MTKIEKILEGLNSQDINRRIECRERLRHLDITPKIGVRLIRAAAADYPSDEDQILDINASLLHPLWHEGHPNYLPAIDEYYDHFKNMKEAREYALRILTQMQTKESLALLIRLLKRPSSRTAKLYTPFVAIKLTPENSPVLFPAIFEALPNLENTSDVYSLTLGGTDMGLFDPNGNKEFPQHCLKKTKTLIEKDGRTFDQFAAILDNIEPDPREGAVPERLKEVFCQVEYLLDILGYINHPDAKIVLHQALGLGSIRLRAFASGALIRQKDDDRKALEKICRHPAGRSLAWGILDGMKRLDRFPEQFRNRKDLAEAEMVRWLQFPTEMGFAPKEIRVLVTVRFMKDNQPFLLFLFKFRHPAWDENKWLVGVAGAYRFADPPAPHGNATFSIFKTLESKDVSGHIRDYLDEKIPYTIIEYDQKRNK